MQKLLPLRLAVFGIVLILSTIILFHFFVLAGVVPPGIVWGGNLADKNQLYLMEAVSISLNALMLLVVLIYGGYIKWGINRRWIITAIWAMAGLFIMNTIGNLLAKSSLETWIFTPLTAVLALFCIRIAISDRSNQERLS